MNKIIHLADLHIRPYKRHDEYREIFNEFYKQLDELKPDRIIIVGDLVHSKIQVSNEQYLLLAEFLSNCAKRARVIIIAGNHDTIVSGDRIDSITPVVEILNNKNIIYFKKSGCYQDEEDNSIVYCVWSCLENQKDPEIEEWQKINDLNKEKTYIGLYHGLVNGATNDYNFSFENGFDIKNFKNCQIICLGDIHKYQTFRNDEIVYSNTMISQSFGETPENHGFVLWEKNDQNEFKHRMIELKNNYGFYILSLDTFENLNDL